MSDVLIDRFAGTRIVVLGDLMVDAYLFGTATRISPEAPVMVVRQTRSSHVPGGAANVARNAVTLGANATLVGVVGDDEAGAQLRAALGGERIDPDGLVTDPTRATTRKTRVLADHAHQVLRIDEEDDSPVGPAIEDQLIAAVTRALEGAQVLVMSDYLKGTLTPRVAETAIAAAKTRGIPVVVNPKPRSLAQYRGASLLSLNRAEATAALGLWRPLEDAQAEEGAHALRAQLGVEGLLVTLGESGMLASGPETFRVEAPRVEVYDTAGAGDTVVAAVALGLAVAGFQRPVFELAAQAAACVVQHVGVATPDAADMATLRRFTLG